jgi:hypothetical protein
MQFLFSKKYPYVTVGVSVGTFCLHVNTLPETPVYIYSLVHLAPRLKVLSKLRNSPEDFDSNLHCRENLKAHVRINNLVDFRT